MSRGGKRDNAGRKSGWVNLETKLIRVPAAIEPQLMAIAKKLDQGEIIESVTESKLDSVTDSIKEIIDRYKKESDKTTLKNTRWDQARKLLNELEVALCLESATESNLEEKELVTESEVSTNDLVTESKGYEVEQIELIPSITQQIRLEPLSQQYIAVRLKVSERSMRNHKDDLAEWSKSKDPDGIAWEYRAETKKYYPLNM